MSRPGMFAAGRSHKSRHYLKRKVQREVPRD